MVGVHCRVDAATGVSCPYYGWLPVDVSASSSNNPIIWAKLILLINLHQ
jgi:hypothetical protein